MMQALLVSCPCMWLPWAHVNEKVQAGIELKCNGLADGGKTVQNIHMTWGIPKIRGTLFGGLHDKAYSILGSMLGSSYLGKLPCLKVHPPSLKNSVHQMRGQSETEVFV